MIFFDKKKGELLQFSKRASTFFWDDHWKRHPPSQQRSKFNIVSAITKNYLKPATRILEGGCGAGDYLLSLLDSGYDVYALDSAPEIIEQLRTTPPFSALKISHGDVRSIPYPDNFFDGYWSLGVIEHFPEGYEAIIKEAERVICISGYFFLVFPYMSPIRRLKAFLGCYPSSEDLDRAQSDTFYQYILNSKSVRRTVELLRFTCIAQIPLDATSGLVNEFPLLRGLLKSIVGKKNRGARWSRLCINIIFSRMCSHSLLFIFKRTA